MPMVGKTNGLAKAEVTKFLPNGDGSQPEYYRMAELRFDTTDTMQEAPGSFKVNSTTDDLANFTTAGVKVLVVMVV